MKHANKKNTQKSHRSVHGHFGHGPFGAEFEGMEMGPGRGSGRGPSGRGGRGGRSAGRGGGRGGGPHGRGGRHGGRRRPRVSRGDVRIGVLAVLNEEPMHGYQIMQELEERSGGGWQPSPGSIYPTLQQLADEGLIASEPVDGKNVFSLTEEGASAVLASEGPPPWERFVAEGGATYANLKRSMFQLGAAARQVAAAGSQAQAEAANEILNEARKGLYRILAEDDPETETDATPE